MATATAFRMTLGGKTDADAAAAAVVAKSEWLVCVVCSWVVGCRVECLEFGSNMDNLCDTMR